jgi:hypothetical protein
MQLSVKAVARLLIIVGNTLAALGCVGLGLVTTGLIKIDSMALPGGMRLVGSVAVAGCLLSAVGYAYQERQIGRKD